MTQALTCAFDMVAAKFASDGRDIDMFFGWRERERHNLQKPRVVWQPGDEGQSIGVSGPNQFAGQTWPLSYGVLWTACTLYVSAPGDSTDPDNERKQWTNTIEVRNALVIALQQTIGQANFRIDSERYETQVGRRANVCVVSVISFLDHLREDENTAGLQPVENAEADVELTELDVTEHFHVPAPTTP